MGHRASQSGGERPPWEWLMEAFLGMLEKEGPRLDGDQVFELFFADIWFQELVEKRTRQAVECHAVPCHCREDLEQTVLLLFVQKTRVAPDLHVNRELAQEHFGGWIWSIIDDLCLQAIRKVRRLYRLEQNLTGDVKSRSKPNLDRQVDVKMLIAGMPILTQTILSLFDEGYSFTEIAELVGEKYWKVCKLQREAIAYLQRRLKN